MGDLSVEVRASTQGSSATEAAFPAPPPPRRPRVREVSSRFMSPVASSSSGDLHLLASKSPCPSRQQQQRSTSAQRRRQTETEPSNCTDEHIRNPPETPLGIQCKTTAQGKSRAVVKLFKENNGGRSEQQQQQQNPDSWRSRTYGDGGKLSVRNGYAFTPSRPDTPTVTDRMASPRSRYLQRSISGPPTATAASKLLQQSSGMSMSMPLPAQSSHQGSSKANGHMGSAPVNHADGSDENSVQSSLAKSLADLRSSMPDADMLPTMSNRFLTERNGNNRSGNVAGAGDPYRFSASPCARSLNMPLSGCDNTFSSVRGTEKSASVLNKSCSNPMKMGGGVCLPPMPPYAKAVAEARKAKKVSGQQEDVHSLKLLHNHYLQWRFANAKAEASMQVQKREVERTLISLRVKMSDMYDSVTKKRIELGLLQRAKSLSTIVEAQMPYLEEWSALEEEYLISLSEVIQALVNASLQLPISGDVRADTREVGEALNSAVKMMEMITLNAQSFMPKAENMERLVSELARLVGGEKALVEECGDMLVKTHMSQVQECCLRSQLMQLQRIQKPLQG